MLNELDLSRKIEKNNYKIIMNDLEKKLEFLVRKVKDLGIPVILVFEGWGASGKGTLINKVILPLDPRLFKVYTINNFNEEEKLRPFLWTFWTKTPQDGMISIFDKSWYRKALVERMDNRIEGEELNSVFNDIRSFEKQLADDGNIILKFYLHISKKEQKKRFKDLEKNDSTKWRVTEADWKHNKEYEKYIPIIEEMIEETSFEYAPWTAVEATDSNFATVKVFSKIIEVLEEKINFKESKNKKDIEFNAQETNKDKVKTSLLSNIDLTKSLSREEYKERLKICQKKIRELEYEIYMKRIPVIIAYEGWDAAGKGGNIKRLTERMDPRGYEVVPIAAPSKEELAHHYLWRFWKEVPKGGHITIFDRTWYGRVLVERIEALCSQEEWKRAYKEINEMEKQFSNFGAVVVKFWLQIDKDVQLERFRERENNPEKRWKITDEDWRNREKYDLYEEAISEMLVKTNTKYAPWTIIESNDKYYARIKALKTVIKALEDKLNEK
ncbi:polyphosphate:AMP phosphotransferase [Clostridium grantii]|uniref:Polyphosphate:AMP phosphotransferase n=1 Tax=Clostridium grantii DSM 8605 TaxID=1121316 RepID=A0A1M5QJP7_9CLOT|nr:polyphosphate:AMP phosphotransferase [Clostridium grantii]SHH14364.1 polyphosphate:AMP phosphotransferase [Clostridium grantii DSM 8605]